MKVSYKYNVNPSSEQVIELYKNSGLPRPIEDKERIDTMFNNSNLVITAWENELLVGVARSITDWVWCCYLPDLAVRKEYQKRGVGKKLIELTQEKIGEQSILLLLSVPTAVEYYPKIGFEKHERSFIINRKN